MNKFCLILLTFFLFSLLSSGQIVELQINKKQSIEIKPCIADGTLEIPERYYEIGDTIYFIMMPKGDWDFSKGDLKGLQTIQIEQSGTIPTIGFKEIVNSSEKIDRILLSFEHKQIKITDQLVFEVEEFTSDIMEFPEHYWPYYYDFDSYYNQGKQLNEQHKYIEAFQHLQHILPGFDHASEYTRFSNYKRAYDMLIPEIVSAYLKNESDILQSIWDDYEGNKDLTSQQLQEFKTTRDSLIITDSIFNSYYSINEPTGIEFKQQHKKLINDYEDLYLSAYITWKKSVLNTIENGNYENENRYQVYIELLARLLVYTNRVEKLSTYDSLDISLVTKNGRSNKFLNKHIDILEKMKWKNDFVVIANLINEEIDLNSTLIGQTHLLNLRGNKEYETQPNYYIINGFNELLKGNFDAFNENISLAISKCTNLEMLYYLELWSFSYRFRQENTDDNLIDNINKGLEYQKKGMPKEAVEQFEVADRIGNCALPPFLIGMINLDVRKEVFSTERFLDEALNIYPGFALANIYYIKIHIDSKQYDIARNKIEKILELPELSIWYIYYYQSILLYQSYDLDGSLKVLQTKCRPFNPYIFDQYIMLGDIHLKQNDCAAAKESYQNAGNLEPNNKTYSFKMQMLVSQCK